MNHKKINEALEQISDRHLLEASPETPKRRMPWLGAAAAVLVLAALTAGLLAGRDRPFSHTLETTPADPGLSLSTDPTDPQRLSLGVLPGSVELLGLVSAPEYPAMEAYPTDLNDFQQYQLWSSSQKAQYAQPEGYADSLDRFFADCLPLLLDGEEANTVCSPVNIYSALAMLAECTGGTSRQQILELLGADSIESLRQQAGYVWNAHFCFDGRSVSILGSSLWLDDDCVYDPDTVSILSGQHYASVFQGDLGSEEMSDALQDWLNDQTGGLLETQARNQRFSADTVLALATTLYYQAAWNGGFSESQTSTAIFHAPGADLSWAFLNKTISQGTYYRGEDYGAVALSLEDGSKLWLVLPQEGKTPQDVLSSGYAVDSILSRSHRDPVTAQIHLSVPRFDVCAETDLAPVLQNLGITDIFSESTADFTPILPQRQDVFLGKASHAARVSIEEEGITGAAYTVMYTYATGAPETPELEIDFVLDRPFLFIVTSSDGLPTFAGVVNQP